MKMIKVSEAKDIVLDYLVAVCEKDPDGWWSDYKHGYINSSSTDWTLGGPIIEREQLSVGTRYTSDQIYHDADVLCWARNAIGGFLKYGPTPLIAAMRCYVASKLGDEVEVPDELMEVGK